MKKAFVTGWPISHSKSPALHGFWLNKLDIAGSYEALPVSSENFPDFLSTLGNSEWVGGNVTIPHKETAFSLIKNCDAAAKAIGAVNTLWIENGDLMGGNTDAYGFSANLDDFAPQWRECSTALVIGAGGASRAVIYALAEAGIEKIRIANRTVSRAQNLSDHFGPACTAHGLDETSDLLADTDLLINTSSMGMSGENTDQVVDVSRLAATSIVTDIVYTPLMTPLLAAADQCGLKTVDGLGMLLHQAVPGFEKWFGARPEVTEELRQRILGVA